MELETSRTLKKFQNAAKTKIFSSAVARGFYQMDQEKFFDFTLRLFNYAK